MNDYIEIEKTAWLNLIESVGELTRQVEELTEKVRKTALSDRWMDVQEVCLALGISKSTLQYYRRQGILGCTFIDRKCYYKASGIKRMLDNGLRR